MQLLKKNNLFSNALFETKTLETLQFWTIKEKYNKSILVTLG